MSKIVLEPQDQMALIALGVLTGQELGFIEGQLYDAFAALKDFVDSDLRDPQNCADATTLLIAQIGKFTNEVVNYGEPIQRLTDNYSPVAIGDGKSPVPTLP